MMNYYGPQQSWKFPKWLGIALGGIFATIAICSGLLIIRLTSSPSAAPVAALATAPLPSAAPVAAPAPAVAAPNTATATPAPVSPPQVADNKHHSRHHEHGKHIAAEQAKAASGPSASERDAIVATHDSKEKRQEKDALDKLLGM
jgi:hypothetical protein